jgi:hypothetical protein
MIYLEPAQVPNHLRGTYTGKAFKVIICESMAIPFDAGLWSGGSRDTYTLIRLSDGATLAFPEQSSAPWSASRQERKVDLEPGIAVKNRTIFCGKDMGITFYLHPNDAAKMLPAPVELTEHEAIVLEATARYKSSYGGKDRYQLAR